MTPLGKELANAGVYYLTKQALSAVTLENCDNNKIDLEKNIVPALINKGGLVVLVSPIIFVILALQNGSNDEEDLLLVSRACQPLRRYS